MFLSGDLMNRLIPEIAKICGYVPGDRVTAQDVEKLAHHIPEADAFQMTEEIARRNYDGAAAKLAELLAGDAEPIEIMGVIGWQVRQLYAAKIAEKSGRGRARFLWRSSAPRASTARGRSPKPRQSFRFRRLRTACACARSAP